MSYTKDEQAANREKWVAALRSGEYPQTRRQLVNETGYCCLGVACDVAANAGLGRWDGKYFTTGDEMQWQVPTQAVLDWLGLTDSAGALTEAAIEEEGFDSSVLTELNDDEEYSFAQIADLIESGKVKVQ